MSCIQSSGTCNWGGTKPRHPSISSSDAEFQKSEKPCPSFILRSRATFSHPGFVSHLTRSWIFDNPKLRGFPHIGKNQNSRNQRVATLTAYRASLKTSLCVGIWEGRAHLQEERWGNATNEQAVRCSPLAGVKPMRQLSRPVAPVPRALSQRVAQHLRRHAQGVTQEGSFVRVAAQSSIVEQKSEALMQTPIDVPIVVDAHGLPFSRRTGYCIKICL